MFLFEHDATLPPPEEVRVQVVGHTWRSSTITPDVAWFDPTVVAEATLAMREAVDEGGADQDGAAGDGAAGDGAAEDGAAQGGAHEDGAEGDDA